MKNNFFSTARITGLLYLGLAITGMFTFLFVKSKIYIDGNAVATATNLVTQEGLARFGIAAELTLVVFQAMVAIWFYKLFRQVDTFTAVMLAAFGIINAVTKVDPVSRTRVCV